MDPPRLPWEVIERIIEKSHDSAETLRSFSLTCHQLLPRSHRVLFSRVTFQRRAQVFSFVDFLEEHPDMKPLIYSIVILNPTDFPPFPLLRMLPNLSEVGFTSKTHNPILQPSTLTCFHRFGTYIHTLRIFDISFATCLPFARILLALPNVVHLTCQNVKILKAAERAPLDVLKRRLSKQMQLKTLITDCLAPSRDDKATVGDLLLDSSFELAPSTVESLTISQDPMPGLFLNPSDWPRLHSLVLRIPYYEQAAHDNYPNALKWLQGFHNHPALKEVSLELHSAIFKHILVYANPQKGQDEGPIYDKLQEALLLFPRPRITWILSNDAPLHANSRLFWASELRKKHPVLSQRGSVELDPGRNLTTVGHQMVVRALSVSPDGRFAATGSDDTTIIIWSIHNKTVVQQWVAHSFRPVQALAFSPDSKYLVSCGKDNNKVAVWDLSHDAYRVAVLEGHTEALASCAWSPDGTVIASGDSVGMVRTWDASAFRSLHVFNTKKTMQYVLKEPTQVTFSSDGRWLGSVSRTQYCIWDFRSGKLHKVIGPDSPSGFIRSIAVKSVPFDREGRRVATISWSGAIEIYSVEDQPGGHFIFRPPGGAMEVAFSPDEPLLLAAMEDGTVRVWDTRTGAQVFQLKGHSSRVDTAFFSPCGRYIASASSDSTVRLWSTRDGTCRARFHGGHYPATLGAFSPDGETFLFVRENGGIFFDR